MLSELISKTIDEDVQNFIFSHENEDERELVLNQKEILGLPAAWIAQQIGGRRRIKFKLPTWYKTKGIIYPPTINLEQCSSEATAKFKASIVSEGKFGIDLTGGLGIDTYYFSRYFSKFIFVEPDEMLLTIAKHNHGLLGANNIEYINTTAENFISQTTACDFVYIDPSRRSHQQKVFKLADCVPNVIELLPSFSERSDEILIKTSPLLDLQQGLRELKKVAQILVVAVDNECKEILFKVTKTANSSPEIHSVDLDITSNLVNQFSFWTEEEKNSEAKFSEPLNWLYEPNAAILKAGAFKTVAVRNNVYKLQPSSHLYTSDKRVKEFPGRTFKVLNHLKLNKDLKDHFPNGQANILTRNFPLSVEEIKKKTGLKEGGTHYLICTQSESQKNVIMAERLFS
jgi:hypothetical protein